MIGSLTGVILVRSPPHLVIEVAGVGYELDAPMSTFYELPAVGASVRLLTHLVVREDAHLLYGFASAGERALFRSLLRVSGIGPRIALAILSGLSGQAFAQAVRQQNVTSLTRVPGVGRKIAERLVIEMRDRLDDVETAMVSGTVAIAAEPATPTSEAHHALLALGYKAPEAARMLKAVGSAEGMGTEDLIRAALQGVLKQ